MVDSCSDLEFSYTILASAAALDIVLMNVLDMSSSVLLYLNTTAKKGFVKHHEKKKLLLNPYRCMNS